MSILRPTESTVEQLAELLLSRVQMMLCGGPGGPRASALDAVVRVPTHQVPNKLLLAARAAVRKLDPVHNDAVKRSSSH
jgi:hypothetical protein